MARSLDYALKYIHQYPKTEQELRTKLFTKGYSEDDIDHTIGILKKQGYINDEQFIKLYIQSEIVKKGKIPALVKKKLLFKGADEDMVEACMAQNIEEMETWVIQRIRKEIEKYKKKGLEGYDIMVKISQKGYRVSDIRKAIKESNDEA